MYEMLMGSLRDKLVREMARRGWKTPDLARESGITHSLIWKYLNPTAGRKARGPSIPQISNLQKLAKALRVSIEDLLKEDGDRVREPEAVYRHARSKAAPEIVLPVETYDQLTSALKAVVRSARVRDPVLRKRRRP
jgi:transcriptional regulator with XRE-family HTH domain